MAVEQATEHRVVAIGAPNKPFHLTPGLAPCGRSVRRR